MELDEDGLRRFGAGIGASLEGPVWLMLSGPLGAGKSTLARAVARGAGVDGPIPSPTFNLMFRYAAHGSLEVVHVDLYRLGGPDELDGLGWDELGDGPEIVLVEWPERADGRLPPDRWEVDLAMVEGRPDRRAVTVRRVGSPTALPAFPLEQGPLAR